MSQPTEVLVVLRDPVYAAVASDAFARRGASHVALAGTAAEAADTLADYRNRTGLILLALEPADDSGLDLLERLKSDPGLHKIPIIVLAPDRVLPAWNRQANCVIHMPATLQDYTAVVHRIAEFWLQTAELPSRYRAEAARL